MMGELTEAPIQGVYDSMKLQAINMGGVFPSIPMNNPPFEKTGPQACPWKGFKSKWDTNVQSYVCSSSIALSKDLVYKKWT